MTAEERDAPTMTRTERAELAALARKRAKVAKDRVDAVAAERIAEAEAQLSAEFSAEDEQWRDITRAATEAIQAADAEIARMCRERGVPEEFRPRIGTSWSSRGLNSLPERRSELRMLARARVASDAKRAKAAIEARSVEVQTELVRDGLTSSAAHAFLASMPDPAQLLPSVDVRALRAAIPQAAGGVA